MPRAFADVVRRVSRGYDLPSGMASQLLGRPQFVILLDDLRDEEASDVFVERPCFGGLRLGASVGNFSIIQLFNPPNSGVLVTVDQIWLTRVAAGIVNLSLHDTALTTDEDRHQFRDRRLTGRPAARIRTEQPAAAVGTIVGEASTPAAEFQSVPVKAILDEGQGLIWNPDTVNNAIEIFWFWKEETL